MNSSLVFSLAARSLWHRRRVMALILLTLTLSVMLLLGVQYLRTEARDSFSNTISGTDLIVGARSGPINLLLYSVFHIGNATANIQWETYQELATNPLVKWTVPISLGDSYRGYRVVGTSTEFPEYFRFNRDRLLSLDTGAWFSDLFDVVLGAEVAREFGHQVGDELTLAHGTGSVSFSKHANLPFMVTGVLAPTGTPVDRAVYVSLEALEAIHVGWSSGVAMPGRTLSVDKARQIELTPGDITAALVGVEQKVMTFQVQREINKYPSEPLTAILPGVALSELWQILGQFERVLLGIAAFVAAVSLVGLAAVLLVLQAQRRHEISILRAIGVSPRLIVGLHVLECVAMAIAACLLAVALGAIALPLLAPLVLDQFGLTLGLRTLTAEEWTLLASVPLAALVVGLLPGGTAWIESRRAGAFQSAAEL